MKQVCYSDSVIEEVTHLLMRTSPQSYPELLSRIVGAPRLHPNGFIQLDLDRAGLERVHIWPSSPLQAQATRHPIHEHAFDMTSYVFRGTITNVTFDFDPSPATGPYDLHTAQRIEGEDTVLVPTGERGYLIRTLSYDVPAGCEYDMRAYIFHDSIATGLTATYMVKTKVHTQGVRPRVAVPYGVTPDNDFRRETTYPTSALWPIIHEVFHG